MSYSLVRVSGAYNEFLRNLYLQNSELKNYSYQEQLAYIKNRAFRSTDFYTKYLNEQGVETTEIIGNAFSLQEQWAIENNLEVSGQQIIVEQIKRIKPDVVMVDDFPFLDQEIIKKIKKVVPSVKLIFSFYCGLIKEEFYKNFLEFDFMLTCSPKWRMLYEEKGLKTHLIYHSFEHSLLPRIENDNDNILTVSFIGAFQSFYLDRITLLKKLIDKKIDVKIFGFIYQNMSREFIEKYGELDFSKFNKHIFPPVFGMDMLKILSASRIGLNIHADMVGEYAANLRLFETTGVGSCLVTENKKSITELFNKDTEIVTYDNIDDCIEKVEWLINNPIKCKNIAQMGKQRTLKDHTVEVRAKYLNNIILQELKK